MLTVIFRSMQGELKRFLETRVYTRNQSLEARQLDCHGTEKISIEEERVDGIYGNDC